MSCRIRLPFRGGPLPTLRPRAPGSCNPPGCPGGVGRLAAAGVIALGLATVVVASVDVGRAIAVAPATGVPATGAPALGNFPAPRAGSTSTYLESFQRDLQSVTRRSAASMVTVIAYLDPPGVESVTPSQPPRRRIGSGILIDREGSIITTFSNIDNAYVLEIQTSFGGASGGQTLRARYLGADHLTNIALLRVEGITGRPARLGESGLITPGSPVVMVGGPQAGQSMATFGAVEVDRGLVLRYSEVEMFRTNTPLFPGSIGAAVIGMDGRVVGMVAGSLTSAQTLPSGGLSGFIFGDRITSAHCSNPTLVVPIEKAQEIAAELRMYGRVARGFLGIQMGTVGPAPGSGSGARARPGIVVQRVLPGSPADVAGLRPGDLILRYSGSDVQVPDELSFLIASTRPGSRIPLAFERRGEIRETTVELAFTEDLAERRLNRLRDPVAEPAPSEPRLTQRIQTGRTAPAGLQGAATGARMTPTALPPGRSPSPAPRGARPDTTRPNGH